MAHLTIADLEKQVEMVIALADPDRPYVYAETGRYKPYMPATIEAAKRKGYVVQKKGQAAFYVYPKPAQVGA